MGHLIFSFFFFSSLLSPFFSFLCDPYRRKEKKRRMRRKRKRKRKKKEKEKDMLRSCGVATSAPRRILE
jgi:hypothetical protein